MKLRLEPLLVAALLGSAAEAQIPVHPNHTDGDGLKQGEWTLLFGGNDSIVSKPSQAYTYRIINYSEGKPIGPVIDYYRSGRVRRTIPRLLSENPERLHGKVVRYLGDKRIQSIEWYDSGRLVFDKTERSEKSLLDSVARTSNDVLYTSQQLDQLGDLYFWRGHYSQADSCFDASLKLRARYKGRRVVEVAVTTRKLAVVKSRQGKFAAADSIFQQAIKLRTAGREMSLVALARNQTQLASVYLAMGQAAKAETTVGNALKTLRDAQLAKSIEYANADIVMARVQTTTGAYAMAEARLRGAMTAIEHLLGKESLPYVDATEAMAALYNRMVLYQKAEPFAKQAVATRKALQHDKHPEYAQALATLAWTNSGLNEYSTALRQMEEAIAIEASTLGERHFIAIVRNRELGILTRLMGDYGAAERHLNKSMAMAEELFGKKSLDYGIALGELSRNYQSIGNYEKAETTCKEALKIVEAAIGKNNYHYAFFVGNLGQLYRSTGSYSLAAQYLFESEMIRKRTVNERNPFYASAKMHEGELYADLGMLATAERIFLEVRDIFAATAGTNEVVYYAQATYNLGGICTRLERFPEAEQYYIETLEIRGKKLGTKHLFYAHALNSVSHLYVRSGRYRMASNNFAEALGIIDQSLGQNNTVYTGTLLSLAELASMMGEKSKADSLFIKLIETDLKLTGELSNTFARDCHLYARHLWQTGRLAPAAVFFDKSVRASMEHITRNFSGMTEHQREVFWGAFASDVLPDYYSFAIDRIALDPTMAERIYDLQLATKALLLNTSAKWKRLILQSTDKKLINSYFTWEELLKRITVESKKDPINEEMLDSLSYEADRLERVLTKRADLFATDRDKKVVTWKDVQARLDQGDVALEVIRFTKSTLQRTAMDLGEVSSTAYPIIEHSDSVYYMFVSVKPGDQLPRLTYSKRGPALEDRYLKQYRNAIKSQSDDQYSFEAYWKPLASQLQGAKRVFISQDGVYNQINLATLRDPATGRYLLDDVDLRIVTNTKDLVTTVAGAALNKYAIVVGMPDYGNAGPEAGGGTQDKSSSRDGIGRLIVDLPGTKVEAETIEKLFTSRSWETDLLLGPKATEDAIKDSFKPAVLHLATHGFFDEDATGAKATNPLMRSGLMLAGAARPHAPAVPSDGKTLGEDGILTAYEAMNLNLEHTDLVVLSACDTGLGELRNGEGVYGLQRSLIVAGAQNLILSLWKVNDEATQKLMVSFYTNWIGGMDRHDAFRAAQSELRQAFDNPYYWGAFIMIGR